MQKYNSQVDSKIQKERDSIKLKFEKCRQRHAFGTASKCKDTGEDWCRQDLGITRESMRRILLKDLRLYPYRAQIKHKLTQADMDKRVVMCQWCCDKIEDNPDLLDDVWFSDEGHVNSKNNIFWGTAAPEDVLQRPLHSTKCTAWVAISKHGIIGPYLFEDKNEKAVTVNTERYLVVTRKLGRRRGITRDEQWFQQDGAHPSHVQPSFRVATRAIRGSTH
jgi:hypothetical protein